MEYRNRSQGLSLFISRLRQRVHEKVHASDMKKATPSDKAELASKHLQANQSLLGPSLLVKGEISSDEDLLIYGSVEGFVNVNDKRLVIGPTARINADVEAGEVIVKGKVKGNIRAKYGIEVGNEGSVTGDMATPEIFIAEGAFFKGSIDIDRGAEKQSDEDDFSATKAAPVKAAAVAAGSTNL